MSYADHLLGDGEVIVVRERQHWLATALEARWPMALLLATLALFLIRLFVFPDGPVEDLLNILQVIFWPFTIAWFALVYINWWTQEYLVTNRRVMKVEGVLNKKSMDSNLEKVNDLVMSQSALGRMLGYGTLQIMTASEVSIPEFRKLRNVTEFKKAILNQKVLMEQGDDDGPPSPPLRAEPIVAPAAAAPAPVAASPAPVPAATRAATGDEVTATLARLADLRDRGAITAEEYEAKKAELLERI